MNAGKRNRELALTRALISRAHPKAIADDPNAMRLRSGEELKAGLGWVWVPHAIVEYRSLEGDTGETNGGHWCGDDGGLEWDEFALNRFGILESALF